MKGDNFIKTKNDLIIGNIRFENRANEMKELKKIFDDSGIKYFINPDFHY